MYEASGDSNVTYTRGMHGYVKRVKLGLAPPLTGPVLAVAYIF